MRTTNRKKIAPVSIAVVAVFALAALLSAGLLVLMPGSTQAQTAPTNTLPDLTLDVGQARDGSDTVTGVIETASETNADNTVTTFRVFPLGARDFTISSDQDEPAESVNLPSTDANGVAIADTNGGIETIHSGNDGGEDAIMIGSTSGEITIPAALASQVNAEQADNTARITVTAMAGTDKLTVRFNLTIVQNPFEEAGIAVSKPTGGTEDSSDCAVVTTSLDDAVLTSRSQTLDTNSLSVLVDGGDCTSGADSVEVALQNATLFNVTEPVTDINYLVYVTGGDSFSKVDGFPGKSGLKQELHEVGKTDALGDPGEAIVTVTRSMADRDGKVYLYGYLGRLDTKRIKSTSEAFLNVPTDFVVVIQFVDGPALAFDSKRDDKTFDVTGPIDDDVDGSTLAPVGGGEPMGNSDENMDGYHDGVYGIPSNNDIPIKIMATINDAKGKPLRAGDKDSRVDFNVVYMPGSDLIDGTANYPSRQVMKERSNEATLTVSGWESSAEPVKVMVSATYTSPLAPDGFDLGTVTLIRVADAPSDAIFGTYSCEPKNGAVAAMGCTGGYTATADMRVGREHYLVVSGKFVDTLGSKTDDIAELDLSDTAKDAFETSATPDISSGYSSVTPGSDFLLVQVKEDAPYDDYTITVTNGETGDAEVTRDLTVTVAGPPMTYEFSNPVTYIPTPLGSSQTFTVMARDENGGVPDFTDADPVSIVVLGVESSYVTGRDATNLVSFDDETGDVTITIFAPVGATQGQTVLIQVRVKDGDVVASHTVMFGVAPTMPGMPMNVMAEATSYDMIAVSWESPADDGGSAVIGYVLQSKTGMMDFMTIAASSAELWWNTLDCQMMNAEIPDDATPAPPMDDTDMTSPYCAMYAGLSAEARTVVDGVFDAEYGTISGTSHSDMGLMAETTYYYRVSAINSAGKGEYSDGMAMAMTMAMMMPSMELGAPSITNVMSDAEGMATVMLMPGDNATKHWVWAAPTDRSEGMWHGDSALAGDATMVTFSGLTSDMNYWFIAVAGRGTGADSEWSDWSGWTAATPIQ